MPLFALVISPAEGRSDAEEEGIQPWDVVRSWRKRPQERGRKWLAPRRAKGSNSARASPAFRVSRIDRQGLPLESIGDPSMGSSTHLTQECSRRVRNTAPQCNMSPGISTKVNSTAYRRPLKQWPDSLQEFGKETSQACKHMPSLMIRACQNAEWFFSKKSGGAGHSVKTSEDTRCCLAGQRLRAKQAPNTRHPASLCPTLLMKCSCSSACFAMPLTCLLRAALVCTMTWRQCSKQPKLIDLRPHIGEETHVKSTCLRERRNTSYRWSSYGSGNTRVLGEVAPQASVGRCDQALNSVSQSAGASCYRLACSYLARLGRNTDSSLPNDVGSAAVLRDRVSGPWESVDDFYSHACGWPASPLGLSSSSRLWVPFVPRCRLF